MLQLKNLSLIFFGCITRILFALNYPQEFILIGDQWTGTCANGRQQTPINIETEKVFCDNTLDLAFHFYDKDISTRFTYHGNLDFFDKSRLTPTTDMMDPRTYQLEGDFEELCADDLNHNSLTWEFKQIHFHSPSQHLVDGTRYDAEIHLVHMMDLEEADARNITRPISLVGIFLTVDDFADENPFISAIDFTGNEFTINFQQLLAPLIGDRPAFYAYEGSLKMPPCDEIVNIYLIKRPLKITSDQLKPIINMLAGNGNLDNAQGPNRIPQPLYERVVKVGNANCRCPAR